MAKLILQSINQFVQQTLFIINLFYYLRIIIFFSMYSALSKYPDQKLWRSERWDDVAMEKIHPTMRRTNSISLIWILAFVWEQFLKRWKLKSLRVLAVARGSCLKVIFLHDHMASLVKPWGPVEATWSTQD